jgi:uncharacterized protein
MKLFQSLMLFLALFAGAAISQDFNKGFAAYNAGDCSTALKEWKHLIKIGNADAAYWTGVIYMNGGCVSQDVRKAIELYIFAADHGHSEAQNNLAERYLMGYGVNKDINIGFKYRKMAAKQGHEYAQYSLALMYKNGEGGVIQNNILAHQWSNIAAANGHDYAVTFRNDLAAQMLKMDVSKAQELARECMSSNYRKCGW